DRRHPEPVPLLAHPPVVGLPRRATAHRESGPPGDLRPPHQFPRLADLPGDPPRGRPHLPRLRHAARARLPPLPALRLERRPPLPAVRPRRALRLALLPLL